MITTQYICLTALKLKLCVVDMASDYVAKKNLGRDDEKINETARQIKFILYGIDTLENYVNDPKINSKITKVSEKGRFFSPNLPDSVSLLKPDPDQINCSTEQEICDLIGKLLTFCPNC